MCTIVTSHEISHTISHTTSHTMSYTTLYTTLYTILHTTSYTMSYVGQKSDKKWQKDKYKNMDTISHTISHTILHTISYTTSYTTLYTILRCYMRVFIPKMMADDVEGIASLSLAHISAIYIFSNIRYLGLPSLSLPVEYIGLRSNYSYLCNVAGRICLSYSPVRNWWSSSFGSHQMWSNSLALK
jgi:hypothetical protein